jgi:hypothetical protein
MLKAEAADLKDRLTLSAFDFAKPGCAPYADSRCNH